MRCAPWSSRTNPRSTESEPPSPWPRRRWPRCTNWSSRSPRRRPRFVSLQSAVGNLGAEPGEWRTTDVTSNRAVFTRRLEALSVQSKERSEAVSQEISRVAEPPVRSFAEAMDHIERADWFAWCTLGGLADRDVQLRSIHLIATRVHNTLMVLAGRGDLPNTIGNFADLARATEQAAELDDAQPASQFRNCSQLVGEALRYTQVAAGKAADILRAQKIEAAKAGSRSGGHSAWAGFTPTTGSGASSSGCNAVPSAARRALRGPRCRGPLAAPAPRAREGHQAQRQQRPLSSGGSFSPRRVSSASRILSS